MIIASAIACLALNIYHEARSEPLPGQYAVALVTMNRAQGSKAQVCEQTFKRKQFSWTTDVRHTKHGWVIPAHLRPKVDDTIESKAWWESVRIASNVLNRKVTDFTGGSTHYHTTAIKPYWAAAKVKLFDIGNHRFYRAKHKSELTQSTPQQKKARNT